MGQDVRVSLTEPDSRAEWWTTSDVAAYLGLRVGTVSSYRKRGQMPEPDMTVGRTHVWKPARIIEWHEAGRGRVWVGGPCRRRRRTERGATAPEPGGPPRRPGGRAARR